MQLLTLGIFWVLLLGVVVLLAKMWRHSTISAVLLFSIFSVSGFLLHSPSSRFFIPSDGQYYLAWSQALIVYWNDGSPTGFPQLWPGKGIWPALLGVIRLVVGEEATLFGIALNAALIAVSGIFLERAATTNGVKVTWWPIVLIFVTSGPMLIFGPSLLREGLFWLAISIGVLSMALANAGLWTQSISNWGVSAVALLAVRNEVGLLIASTTLAVIIVLWGVKSRLPWKIRGIAVPFTLSLLTLGFFRTLDFLRPAIEPALVTNVAASLSQGVNSSLNRAGTRVEIAPTSLAIQSDVSLTVCDNLLSLKILCEGVLNLPAFIAGPFPWELTGELVLLVAFLASIHFILVVLLATRALFNDHERVWLNLGYILVAAATAILFSSVLTNYGIIMRFRVATEILLIPLALKGLLGMKIRKS